MTLENLSIRQQILLSDAEHDHSGSGYSFRLSSIGSDNIDRITATEKVRTASLLRVLIREGAKSFLGFDIEAEQQATAE